MEEHEELKDEVKERAFVSAMFTLFGMMIGVVTMVVAGLQIINTPDGTPLQKSLAMVIIFTLITLELKLFTILVK